MVYLGLIALALGIAYLGYVFWKQEKDVKTVTLVPIATANPSVEVKAPVATVIPGTAIPSNPILDAYLHGGDGGNSAGVKPQTGSDPYGDHNGNVLFGDGGYVWFAQGLKLVTIKDVVPGQVVQISTADGGTGSVKVDVQAPSGTVVTSFTADVGADGRIFIAPEAGDYRVTVDSKAVRGSVRMSRNS